MPKKTKELTAPVVIAGKEYHLKTYIDKTNSLISELTLNGNLITRKIVKLKNESDEKEVITLTERIHKDYIHELSILNHISEEEENQQNVKFLLFLGAVYYTKGLIDDAETIFKKALKWENNCVEAYNYLGAIALKKKDVPLAIDHLKRAATLAPELLETKLKLVDAYLELGNTKKAEEELTRITKNHPEYHYSYWYLSLLFIKKLILGNFKPNEDLEIFKETVDLLKKGFQLAKDVINKDTFEQAFVALNGNHYDEAYKSVQMIIESCKNSFLNKEIDNFHIVLMEYKKQKKVDNIKHAIDEFKQLLQENPNEDLHNKLGILHFIIAQDMLKNAYEHFKNALDMNPNYTNAQKNLNIIKTYTRNIDNTIFDFLKQ